MSICYRKKQTILLILLIGMAALLGSCLDFFSNSWASWAARDPSSLIPAVTLDNVNDLIEMAENDPDLSLALLLRIGEAVDDASDEEKAALQAAAVEAAVNAVGLGQTIAGAAGDFANISDVDSAIDVIMDAINNMPNLDEVSEALFDLLPAPGSGEFNTFIENATAEEIALAAILLLAGEAKKYDSDPNHNIHNFDISGEGSDEAELAKALAMSLTTIQDELPPNLYDILSGLNLIN